MKSLVLIAVAAVLLAASAHSATYWVRPGGSDIASGADSANAYLTIQRGVDNAGPGDIVLVCGGTYPERVVTQDAGTSGNEITLMGYPGHTVVITGGSAATTAYTGRSLYIEHDYWDVRNIRIEDNRYNSSTERYYWMLIDGSHVDVSECTTFAAGDIATIYATAQNRMIGIGGQYVTIDSSEIRGGAEGIEIFSTPPRHYILRRNFIHKQYANNIVAPGDNATVGVYHAGLIEFNVCDTSITEDNLQFQQNYTLGPGVLVNSGVIVRGNTFANAGENCIDMKATNMTVTIERNILINASGDDDGSVGGNDDWGGEAIMAGAGDYSRYAIIRHNLILGNHGGIHIYPGMHVFNNTIVNNSHSYRGWNSTSGSYTGVNSDNEDEAGELKVLLNNILSDESGASNRVHVSMIKANAGNLELDYNLYFQSTDSAMFVTNYPDPWPTNSTYTGLVAWKAALQGSAFSGWAGKDEHSISADPLFSDVPANPGAYDPDWDFTLGAGSPGLGAARALTFADGSGSPSSSLVVEDPYFFMDGYGVSGEAGDSLVIGDETQVGIASINYSTRTITLSAGRTWGDGDSVWLYQNGAKITDLGAVFSSGSEPPPPPPPVAYDTVDVSWNIIKHDLTITGNTFFRMTNIQRTGVDVLLQNPSGFAVAWDDTIQWLTAAPASVPGAVSWFSFSRWTATNRVYGAMTGPTSSESVPTYFGSVLGNPTDNVALTAALNNIDADLVRADSFVVPAYRPFEFENPTSSLPRWRMNSHRHDTQTQDNIFAIYHNLVFNGTSFSAKQVDGRPAWAMQMESQYDSAVEWNANLWTVNDGAAAYRRVFHMNAYYNTSNYGRQPGDVNWRWWLGRIGLFGLGFDAGGAGPLSGMNEDSLSIAFTAMGDNVKFYMRNYLAAGKTTMYLTDSTFGYLRLRKNGNTTDSLFGVPTAYGAEVTAFGWGGLFLGTLSDNNIYFGVNNMKVADLSSGGLGLYGTIYMYTPAPQIQMVSSTDGSRNALFKFGTTNGSLQIKHAYDIQIWPGSGKKILYGDSTAYSDSVHTFNGGVWASNMRVASINAGKVTFPGDTVKVYGNISTPPGYSVRSQSFMSNIGTNNTYLANDGTNHYLKSPAALYLQTNSTTVAAMFSGANTTLYGTLGISGTITPSANNTYSLGSSSYRWATAFMQTLDVNGPAQFRAHMYHLNKAANNWLTTFSRNTSGSEVVLDAPYMGTITATQYRLAALNSAPASASATGTTGEVRWTNGYFYFCVATDTWQRGALATW